MNFDPPRLGPPPREQPEGSRSERRHWEFAEPQEKVDAMLDKAKARSAKRASLFASTSHENASERGSDKRELREDNETTKRQRVDQNQQQDKQRVLEAGEQRSTPRTTA